MSKIKGMKTIIVGVDFSVSCSNVVKYAVGMAKSIGCSLVLLNVYQIPVTFSEIPIVNPTIDELKEISISKLRELKDTIDRTESSNIKVYLESRLGNVTEELLELSQKINPFSIIIGTGSKTGVEEFFMGSNAMAIIKLSIYPVILIPQGIVFHVVKKIAIATDLKNVVTQTPSETISNFVSRFNSKLVILNVDDSNKIDAEKNEEALLIDSIFYEHSPSYGFINDTDTERGIEKYVAEENIDLLITIPKKHSWLSKLFSISNTKLFLRETKIPLVCIHA
jgi:nucleotide-binding universal stress UspA family protein